MTKERQCSLCKSIKLLTAENFYCKSVKKNTFGHICKPCWKIYRKKHYEENKEKYINKAANWTTTGRIKFFTWLKTQKCVDCGNKDFRVLEFDHKENKSYNVSTKIGKVKFEVLLEEIKKCDIVCANCHRIRTSEHRNYYSYLMR